MSIILPEPIAAYFDADRGKDAATVARCFTETAVVEDEGHTYAGRDAIRRWKAGAASRYTYKVEPFRIETEGDRVTVTSHLAGDFSGSPTDLRYVFVLAGTKIAGLEIAP